MTPLPEPKIFHQMVGRLSDLLVEVEEEYRWSYPGFYNPDRREEEKVTRGHPTSPTESVGLPNLGFMTRGEKNEYARRRTEADSGIRLIGEVEMMLKAVKRCFQAAQPKFRGGLEYDIQDRSGVVGPRYVKKQREFQKKRIAEGGGYGDS